MRLATAAKVLILTCGKIHAIINYKAMERVFFMFATFMEVLMALFTLPLLPVIFALWAGIKIFFP